MSVVCLSSGGGCGFLHIGLSSGVAGEGHVEGCCCKWSDVRSEGIVGLLWVLGLTFEEMEDALCLLNDESVFSIRKISLFLTQYGLDDGEYMLAYLIDIILSKHLDPEMTLLDLRTLFEQRSRSSVL